MFGQIGWSEILLVAFVGLVVLGPERLPQYARDAGKMIRQLRAMANNATADLRKELPDEFKDLNPRDLNPREMMRRLIDDEPIVTRAPAADPHPHLAWTRPPVEAAETTTVPTQSSGAPTPPNGMPATETNSQPVRTGFDDIT